MVSSVPYISISPNGEEETHSVTATRRQVQSILPNFHHLRTHLRAIVNILDTHSPKTFSQLSLSSLNSDDKIAAKLATDQILFIHHHNAMSETLESLQKQPWRHSFGLPENYGAI
jgi:hypothetical protein